MGLFDDILKKPQESNPSDSTGQGSTGIGYNESAPVIVTSAPQILIQKTQEEPLLSMEKTIETSVQPAITEEAAMDLPQAPAITEEAVMDLPQETTIEAPIITQEIAPIITDAAPTILPENDPIGSLNTQEVTPPSSPIMEEGIFGFPESTPTVQLPEKTTLHPKDFIEKSIADIDSMIADIDGAHDAKISEALGYQAEKDRFASLEANAYTEASVLDDEKSQALHVRELLESELGSSWKTSSTTSESSETGSLLSMAEEIPATGSVETTLTNLAVQNTVSETIEPAKSEEKMETTPATHSTKKKKEEASEEILSASLV